MSMVMSNKLSTKYPHIMFTSNWTLTARSTFLLGQCEAYVQSIGRTPILPELHQKLLTVSLIKGARATTAIEGNTLTEEEVERVHKGEHIAPSKEYQEIEVRNILDAFNDLMDEIIIDKRSEMVSPGLIKKLHLKVGKNLGENFESIPGKFRQSARNVATYKCPDHEDIEELIDSFCAWIQKEFHYDKEQQFSDCIIQAIASHVYLEWIHPFGDGNGRTGRLLEFYILIRGGNPDIASHLLSNHYNETRAKYYTELENAGNKRNLTEFIEYALEGLRDGLDNIIDKLQNGQIGITWHKFIYDTFAKKPFTTPHQKAMFKRQRELILAFEPGDYTLDQVSEMNPSIAKKYATLSVKTLKRDLDELMKLELIIQDGTLYSPNIHLIRQYFPVKKNF